MLLGRKWEELFRARQPLGAKQRRASETADPSPHQGHSAPSHTVSLAHPGLELLENSALELTFTS